MSALRADHQLMGEPPSSGTPHPSTLQVRNQAGTAQISEAINVARVDWARGKIMMQGLTQTGSPIVAAHAEDYCGAFAQLDGNMTAAAAHYQKALAMVAGMLQSGGSTLDEQFIPTRAGTVSDELTSVFGAVSLHSANAQSPTALRKLLGLPQPTDAEAPGKSRRAHSAYDGLA